ncbi:protein PET117 homolog, mitochondrial isoform X2 [Athalia rosae]|uniref:protein PET117 homolog, mitochondrial isoform X2 n=1 Tax=Athalia rosae TaxID=37344 RepID=UPI0006259C91|nr:protein PET117 homolog, mitochondrial isoform X2 [Athalia rosae]
MTTASRTVLGLSCAISLGIIGTVHYQQYYDREQLHLGVVRDVERQERIKRENLFALTRQKDLTKELQREEQQAANDRK